MTRDPAGSAPPGSPAAAERFAGLRGEVRLRTAIDDLANQMCASVDGDFDFLVRSPIEDETLEKLAMLINFVLDTARRGMTALRGHNDALARLDQAKTVFFSNASHELRTPLTLMLGPIEDALARPDRALAGEALEAAYRNAVRLHKLVNSLLDFSRIEGGRLRASFEPLDLAALTRDLAGVFRAAVERAGLRLDVDCPPLSQPTHVDREMWETIVLNLVSNAFKFTFTGRIGVSLREVDGAIELAVEDTGAGIPAAELPRIFERFHRVEGTPSRTHEGFGIGLAMIHELVRLHGGTIEAASTPGAGSRFTVRVPRGSAHLPHEQVARAADAERAAVRAYVQEADSWTGSPAPDAPPAVRGSGRILLADDNADMRAYVSRLLSEHWEVTALADGQAALEAALRDPPDLVVADVMMPRLDGYGLLRALRADDRTRTIPVVLVSARAGPAAVAEGLATGADDYVIKPFSARELVARVRTHLELSRLRLDSAIIAQVSALLNSRMDPRDVVQVLIEKATRLCGAEFGAYFYNVVDAGGESYMLYAIAGVPRAAFEKFPLPRNTPLFDPTFSGTGTVRLDDVRADPRYGRLGPHHGMPHGHLPVCSYLAVPVVSRDGRVLGGLFFGHSQPGMFDERGQRLIEAVAGQAAVALDNAHLYEAAQRARSQAEAATRAKDEFLAILGHEMRNPLAPILNAIDLMSLRGDTRSASERDIIRRQVAHMVRLVDDLLDVSRLARGKIDLALEPVELGRAVAKGIELAAPLIEQRQHRLGVSVPERGLVVNADLVRLTQVVANLLGNAAKYTENGGSITITAGRDGPDIVLRIRDNGIGIPAANLARIFEIYEQGQESARSSEGGLGLGLAIVRRLVTMHGGTVTAASDGPGRGSEFVVRLPAMPAVGAPEAPTAEMGPDQRAAQRRRILVVDDHPDAAQLLAASLGLLGHEVRVVRDGPSALMVSEEFRPHVVLLDIALPLLDGYEVARRLRASPRLAGVRLYAVTGYGQQADRQRSAEAGFDGHLVKPVSLALLERTLAGMTGPR